MQSNDMVLSVAFSPDGKALALGTGEGIKPDGPAHRRRAGFQQVCSGSVESLAYSPDGSLLAAGTGMVTKLLDPAGLAGDRHAPREDADRETGGLLA